MVRKMLCTKTEPAVAGFEDRAIAKDGGVVSQNWAWLSADSQVNTGLLVIAARN
jgi:hypothetical protein